MSLGVLGVCGVTELGWGACGADDLLVSVADETLVSLATSVGPTVSESTCSVVALPPRPALSWAVPPQKHRSAHQ
jgi:hypothetical protein